MARGKKKISARVQQAVDAMYGMAKEPSWTPMQNSDADLMVGLNFYSSNMKQDASKKFAIDWAVANRPDLVENLHKVRDIDFTNRGFILRMVSRGFTLSKEQLEKIIHYLEELKPEVVAVKKVTKKKQMKVNLALEQFDAIIDKAMMGESVDQIVLNPDTKELKEVLVAAQYIESDIRMNEDAYNPRRARCLIRTIKQVREHIEGLASAVREVKEKVQKDRKVRPVDTIKKTANVEVMMEFKELNLKGIHPSKVFGASTVVMYDTKYKNIVIIKGSNLEIRGKTIVNVNDELCKFKHLKKPENFFADFMNKTPTQMIKAYDAVDYMQKPASGRLSDRMIILKAF